MNGDALRPSLAGRSVFLTGASRGLGLAIAARLIEEGASLFICAREPGPLAEAQKKLQMLAGKDQRVESQPLDVCDPVQVDAAIARALKAFPDMWGLVNNAGIHGPIGPLEEVDVALWVKAVQTNLIGTMLTCRSLLGHFKKRGGGRIVNLSGGGGTAPLPFMSGYAASKAGIVRLTENIAAELGGVDISVNAVAPGAMATRLIDEVVAAGPEKVGADYHRRMLDVKKEGGVPPERAAALVAWLLGDRARGISGKLISAVWDPWEKLDTHRDELAGSDIYTLRRILPSHHGKGWGEI